MPGKFIVFEGLDGSGLSTQALMLRDWLITKGNNVVVTKEQTDGAVGGLIKSCLKHEWKTSPLALQLLFVADRAHHLATEIEPALAEGKNVICDRYVFSTLAFGALGVDIEFLKTINSKFRIPDITFIIDCLPDVCLQRIGKSRFSHTELFEEKGKFEKVRATYHSLVKFWPNVYVIDGNRPKDVIFAEIRKIAEKHGL